MFALDNLNLPEYTTESKKPAADRTGRMFETRRIGEGKPQFQAKMIGKTGVATVDPSKLSQRQWQVINRFARKHEVNPNAVAPYINLIFKVYSFDVTLERFQKLTGIELTISTFDDFSEHNL